MAALSFYSNSYQDSASYYQPQPQQRFSSDMSPELFYLTHPQLLHDPTFFTTFDYPSADSAFFSNAPFFDDASPFVFSDCYSTTDVYSSLTAPSADNFIPISTDVFPSDEFEFPCPKRQKVTLEQNFCCGGGGGGGGYFPQVLTPPELFSVPWDDNGGGGFVFNDNRAPAPSSEEMAGGCLKKLSPANNLSAQTIAARERRRKITAKTQELGELIPGGNKMNTAEMLQSAFKYVKFLQAQVSILQLMQETEEEEEDDDDETSEKMEELRILESVTIQEKLYSEEKCLVPLEFVQNLANFPEIQSQPTIFNSINQMLQTSSS